MKKVNQIIWLVLLVTVISCNSSTKKLNNNGIDNSLKSSNFKMSEITSTKDSVIPEKKPTSGQIYSAIETKLDLWAKIKFDSSTIVKHYENKNGKNEHEISCYFSKDHLISVENRIISETGEDISFMMFHFDDKNICFANYRKDNEKDTSRFYAYINNYVIEYDHKLKPFIVDSLKKKQIIQETRTSLESNMQRFPEFKYSFNWK